MLYLTAHMSIRKESQGRNLEAGTEADMGAASWLSILGASACFLCHTAPLTPGFPHPQLAGPSTSITNYENASVNCLWASDGDIFSSVAVSNWQY